ncbi:hypothetical protein FA09DRAFT_322091 [Tilletiopsis washingtonensis]|uniref:RPA43 OB domain-containing protein n=1 Tax=Tilletiopsis washingtonensis TaxID=58919 RepID=A0A316Z3H8_9BASI|nr:hypothetical protein FA09DRAFT_322091 [Tilletiopsis washingtonensis]PWN95936.1 hypothetical protein FA09DRAFT_322091 [Tilletiopsis washingtonensis]
MAASLAASAAASPAPSKEQRRAAKAERKAAAHAAAAAAPVAAPPAAASAAPAVASGSRSARASAPRPPRSAFVVRYASMQMAIAPALSERPAQAVQEAFDSMLMRYVPPLGGVLVAHDEAMFLSSTARFDGDGAYAVAPAAIKCLVWAPTVGMRVEGTITLSTPSHVSLLLHGTFNASISAAHMPSAQAAHEPSSSFQRPNAGAAEWEFVEDEEAAAEDAARRRVLEGGSASEQSSVKEEAADADEEEEEDKADAEPESKADVERSEGYWKRKSDGQRLGGADGRVAFTIIGMTIANHQLSLHGSLLPAPFSVPLSVPLPAKAAAVVHPVPSGEARRVRWQDENSEVSDDPAAAPAAAAPSADSRGKKRKLKVGPQSDAEASASESEPERAEKKQRKKDKKAGGASESEAERAEKKQRRKDKKAKREQH